MGWATKKSGGNSPSIWDGKMATIADSHLNFLVFIDLLKMCHSTRHKRYVGTKGKLPLMPFCWHSWREGIVPPDFLFESSTNNFFLCAVPLSCELTSSTHLCCHGAGGGGTQILVLYTFVTRGFQNIPYYRDLRLWEKTSRNKNFARFHNQFYHLKKNFAWFHIQFYPLNKIYWGNMFCGIEEFDKNNP